MTLSSIPFIFLFLPVFTFIYFIIPKKWWRTLTLLIGSLLFLAWIDPNHLYLFVLFVLFNYFLGLIISWLTKKNESNVPARIFTFFAVAGNLAILVFYKYVDFFLTNFNLVFKESIPLPDIVLPIGISYFTFTGISYVVDVYQQVIPGEKNLLKFANYLIMFPKILLGPITRYSQVHENLTTKWFVNENFLEGVKRFCIGLGKKVILADNFSIISTKVFNSDFNQIGVGVSWFGLISYALQIFFDFAGYTDMAIGLGLIFGYKLPENFNYPYISKSISEFWRRWHMSLTGWFRTYVFLPLEFKRKKILHFRQPVDILIVFLLTGLWHGAGWNFIIWGGYFGIILALESMGVGKFLKKIPPILQHLYSILLILFGWVFFRINDIGLWRNFLLSMFGRHGFTSEITLRSLNVLLYSPLLIVGIILATPLPGKWMGKLEAKGIAGKMVTWLVYLTIFVLSIGYLLSNGYVSFLYSQF